MRTTEINTGQCCVNLQCLCNSFDPVLFQVRICQFVGYIFKIFAYQIKGGYKSTAPNRYGPLRLILANPVLHSNAAAIAQTALPNKLPEFIQCKKVKPIVEANNQKQENLIKDMPAKI